MAKSPQTGGWTSSLLARQYEGLTPHTAASMFSPTPLPQAPTTSELINAAVRWVKQARAQQEQEAAPPSEDPQ